MGWLIALAVVAAIAVLPLGIRIRYDSDGPAGWVLVGPVRAKVFPLPKGEKKPKPQKKEPKPKKAAAATKPAEKKGGSLKQFLPLVHLALDLLTDFRRKLRVNCLELNLVLGGDDPCDLAVNYGKTCAAMGNIWPRLEEFFVIKKRDVKIQCDFEASETLITARIDLTITVGRLLSISVWHGFKIIREFLRIKNQGKGGAAI